MALRSIFPALALWLVVAAVLPAAADVSFERDVMAVISKAGCNAGTCHGKAEGKGGFKLSLRGESPERDYKAIAGDPTDGRVRSDEPAKSLILLKPTEQAKQGHEGGKRFEVDSPEYRILREWIEAGARGDAGEGPKLAGLTVAPPEKVVFGIETPVQLEVTATFSDGEKRDVTRWAVYEPFDLLAEVSSGGEVRASRGGETVIGVRYLRKQAPVRLAFMPPRPGYRWDGPEPSGYIDEHVFAKLRRLRITPSPLCDDSTFVRRVHLDLVGMLPSGEEAREFVESVAPDKRARLVDELLERPEFADFWALKWADLLRVEEKVMDSKGVEAFHGWIRGSIQSGKPMDRFVREILTAAGSTYKNPPANYYRALRNPTLRAEAVAQVFLGTRLQCAQCHDHPFDRWTMDDYYRFAALFDRMDYEIVENKRQDKNDKNMFIGEQIVKTNAEAKLVDPRTDRAPRAGLLDPEAPEVHDHGEDGAGDRFESLADWVTAPENPLFARVQANRIWSQLMGRGIVSPVDDFRATNPPSNPALLEALTDDFVGSGYDLRHVVRRIVNSSVYQLASVPNETNGGDEINYSRAATRRLGAEQLFDAMHQVAGARAAFNGYDGKMRAAQVRGVNAVFKDSDPSFGDRFLKLFGKPPRLMNSDLERSYETSLAQTFELVSGPGVDALLRDPKNRLSELADSGMETGKMIESLYWSALSRPPADEELEAFEIYAAQARDLRTTLEDVTWGLINSKEFLLRR